MKTLRNIFARRKSGSGRFDRYYGRVAHAGEGYPTADEARQDLRNQERSMIMYGLPR